MERFAAHIDIFAIAVDEIHRHIENIIRVCFEAETFVEDEGQHPGPVRIRIGPDETAKTLVSTRLAFDKGRIGEKGGCNRLQCETNPHFLNHVRFRSEVQVDLNGAASKHHIETVVALLRHVLTHDLITAFRHPTDILAPRLRIEAKSKDAGTDLFTNRLHLVQMRVHFVASLMNRLQHGAG